MGKIEWGLSSGRAWQRRMSVNFLILSYRGFGRSQGEPTMIGIQQDSQVRSTEYPMGDVAHSSSLSPSLGGP